ncbi:hypothetical protein [Synechococcus sp. CBW1006]|uniref:hypothetical protein n=1 Tax=Synechococcus sp. CBW1006 TaxID=1353138 RepID=UPI0018CF2FBE|nr:hypothetical protein [Synechococcus sp. CBW1006]QPN66993.1 hypothetical protein H8F26_01415 [Synechococcus sp. CBW1006]
MIWALAALYLIIEGREITQLRQLTTFSTFAVLFVVGSFQVNVARLLLSVNTASRIGAAAAYRASILMFLASVFAVLDGCLDLAIARMSPDTLPILPLLIVFGWLINLASVGMALWSMEIVLRVITPALLLKRDDWNNEEARK